MESESWRNLFPCIGVGTHGVPHSILSALEVSIPRGWNQGMDYLQLHSAEVTLGLRKMNITTHYSIPPRTLQENA